MFLINIHLLPTMIERKLKESTIRGFNKMTIWSLKNWQWMTNWLKHWDRIRRFDSKEKKVKRFVSPIRKSGRVVNTAIVKATEHGVVISVGRSFLQEKEGHIDITRTWALFLMSYDQVNLVKRSRITSKKLSERKISITRKLFKKFMNTVWTPPPPLIIN